MPAELQTMANNCLQSSEAIVHLSTEERDWLQGQLETVYVFGDQQYAEDQIPGNLPAAVGQPFSDQAIIFELAGLRLPGPEITVDFRKRDDRLPRWFVVAVIGGRVQQPGHGADPSKQAQNGNYRPGSG
jgi:hypothetical protein